jgi:hypothetical protein
MLNAQTAATMAKALRSIERNLNLIEEAKSEVIITTHQGESTIGNCVHCGENYVVMHCDKCWAPICYDCAKNSSDNKPICRECKTKEVGIL